MARSIGEYRKSIKERKKREYARRLEGIVRTIEQGFDDLIKRGESKIIYAYPASVSSADMRLMDDVVDHLTALYIEHGWSHVSIRSFRGSHVIFTLNLPE